MQGINDQKMYLILNRAVGLEGLTKAQVEEILGLTIKTAIPHMGSNFALANNLHQPITIKYPTDTASIILKETAENMLKLARLRQKLEDDAHSPRHIVTRSSLGYLMPPIED
jgi:hypothetical protein